MIHVRSSLLLSRFVGESTKLVNAIFQLATLIAQHGRHAIIFVDECDALLGNIMDMTDHGAQVCMPARRLEIVQVANCLCCQCLLQPQHTGCCYTFDQVLAMHSNCGFKTWHKPVYWLVFSLLFG